MCLRLWLLICCKVILDSIWGITLLATACLRVNAIITGLTTWGHLTLLPFLTRLATSAMIISAVLPTVKVTFPWLTMFPQRAIPSFTIVVWSLLNWTIAASRQNLNVIYLSTYRSSILEKLNLTQNSICTPLFLIDRPVNCNNNFFSIGIVLRTTHSNLSASFLH